MILGISFTLLDCLYGMRLDGLRICMYEYAARRDAVIGHAVF